MALMN